MSMGLTQVCEMKVYYSIYKQQLNLCFLQLPYMCIYNL